MSELRCKKFFGKIIRKGSGPGTKYLDQLSDEIIWVPTKQMYYYIRDGYNLTLQEYFNLIVYGDEKFYPKCPYCNHPRKFWRLVSGYYTTCADPNCISSCHSEDNSYRWIDLKKDPIKYREFCNKLGYASPNMTMIQKLDSYYEKWMKLGDPNDICWFYIATTKENQFKFGVTQDIKQRAYRMGYKNYKLIFEAERWRVGDLEYCIKLKLDMLSEYLDWTDVGKFRKAYVDSIKII